MKKIFLLMGICCLSLNISGQIKEQSAIDSIFAAWDRPDAPGCAVGIVQDGELIFAKGYGIADLEHDIPIDPSSAFYIGSESKQFVTFCILLLEEQGKIGLDDNIQKYLPDFPEYQSPLTIRHFIHHTSGVRDFLELMDLKGRNYLDNLDVDEVYELIKSQEELNFDPGEQYMYSNSCYFMLAMIIEKAAGESLRSFADKNIFKPLGMKSTLFYDDNTDLIKNRVFSYQRSPDGDGFDNLISRFDLVGSGGLYSTIEDLYLWDQNFYNNRLGNGGQEIIEKMHEEGLLNNGESSGYAFALNNGTYKGLRTVSHGGALAGYRSMIMRFPDQNFSVIILANRGDFNPGARCFEVADVFLKDQYLSEPEEEASSKPESAEAGESLDLDLEQMTGKYEIAQGVIAEISIQHDSLHVLQTWNNIAYNLSRTGSNTFLIPSNPDILFTFSELENDRAQKLTVLQNGGETLASRMPDTDLSTLILSDYTGDYYSREIDATYRVFSEGEQLKIKTPDGRINNLDAVNLDAFISGPRQMEFIRSNSAITGFELDAGRVQNLKFEKK